MVYWADIMKCFLFNYAAIHHPHCAVYSGTFGISVIVSHPVYTTRGELVVPLVNIDHKSIHVPVEPYFFQSYIIMYFDEE